MMSARECLEHATRCEQLAKASSYEANRTALFVTAQQWRALGQLAQGKEARTPAPSPKPNFNPKAGTHQESDTRLPAEGIGLFAPTMEISASDASAPQR
jgi:hypothetical protein